MQIKFTISLPSPKKSCDRSIISLQNENILHSQEFLFYNSPAQPRLTAFLQFTLCKFWGEQKKFLINKYKKSHCFSKLFTNANKDNYFKIYLFTCCEMQHTIMIILIAPNCPVDFDVLKIMSTLVYNRKTNTTVSK